MEFDGDLEFAQDTSISGQFAQQSKVCTVEKESTLGETANSKIRRVLARNGSFGRPDVPAGKSVLLYKPMLPKSMPGRRGPATALEIDDMGVFVKL